MPSLMISYLFHIHGGQDLNSSQLTGDLNLGH